MGFPHSVPPAEVSRSLLAQPGPPLICRLSLDLGMSWFASRTWACRISIAFESARWFCPTRLPSSKTSPLVPFWTVSLFLVMKITYGHYRGLGVSENRERSRKSPYLSHFGWSFALSKHLFNTFCVPSTMLVARSIKTFNIWHEECRV